MTQANIKHIRSGGPRLAKLIDEAYPTRAAFGEAALLNSSEVSRYCTGARKPPERTIPRICDALGIEYEFFVSLESENALVEALQRELAHERETRRLAEHRLDESRVKARELSATISKIKDLLP